MHTRETLLVTITEALKVPYRYQNGESSFITLQVVGIWDTQRFFPTLTTASLLPWYVVSQAQLPSAHTGFDSQKKKTLQPQISAFVNYK